MRKPKYIISLLLLLLSCNSKEQNPQYQLNVSVDNTLKVDSVHLYIYEDSYDKIRKIDDSKVVDGKVQFKGQIEKSCVAYLRFDNDTVCHYFVLENANQTYSLGNSWYKLEGGRYNHEYYKYILWRQRINNDRKLIALRYQNMLKDSTLTKGEELRLYNKDSLLALKQQTALLSRINKVDIISIIIAQQFGNEISPKNLAKINGEARKYLRNVSK